LVKILFVTIDFVAIDFETANSFRGSPCALGLVKVINGEITDSISFLMKPPLGFDEFDELNMSIHGITPKDVANEPRFADLWPSIQEFIGQLPLIAHYASFDIGVLRDSLSASKLEWPSAKYYCTVVLGRKVYSGLLSYSLPFVAEAAGVELIDHHNAIADATADALIMIDIFSRKEVSTFELLENLLEVRPGFLVPNSWKGCGSTSFSNSYKKALENLEVNSSADPDHPLFGQTIVFTGELQSMKRVQAWEAVAALGAIPEGNVTSRSTILVQGTKDFAKFRPGESLSSKARKAQKLIQSGQLIEVMPEVDFIKLIT
jgi:DNA polymerase III subunit epsilon